MGLVLLIGTSPYFCFIVIIISGLLFRQKFSNEYDQDLPFVSVVIAARNEEKNISNLLEDLITQTIDKNNWLHTGDLGRMDNRGYVTITGRIKEMIIRGGENHFPAEIENTLREHKKI